MGLTTHTDASGMRLCQGCVTFSYELERTIQFGQVVQAVLKKTLTSDYFAKGYSTGCRDWAGEHLNPREREDVLRAIRAAHKCPNNKTQMCDVFRADVSVGIHGSACNIFVTDGFNDHAFGINGNVRCSACHQENRFPRAC